MNMSFIELAENRYSVRSFSDREVEQEKIDLILRAGQVAPTACNNQPQKILVIKGEEMLAKWHNCTKFNFNETLVILTCYDKNLCWKRGFDGKTSGDVDASIVTTHMMLEAADIGIGSTWVMYFDPELVSGEFDIPENFEIVSALVMGYPAENAVPSPMHSRMKPIEETTF